MCVLSTHIEAGCVVPLQLQRSGDVRVSEVRVELAPCEDWSLFRAQWGVWMASAERGGAARLLYVTRPPHAH